MAALAMIESPRAAFVLGPDGCRRRRHAVHGGFVDGSGWLEVYDLLTQDGYNVAVVQNPTLSLEGDVAATRQAIDAQDGPVVLVGHSYGGAVISLVHPVRRERRV